MLDKSKTGTKLRTAETWKRYKEEPKREDGKCFMCETGDMPEMFIAEFEYWYVFENRYPYDQVAKVHHLLFPKSHCKHEDDLIPEERWELDAILREYDEQGEYDCVIRNFQVGQSQKQHIHYHLLVWERTE